MKTFTITLLATLVTIASGQEFRAPLGPQKPVRAMPTPPAYLVRPEVQGVVPRAFSDSRNPFQMLNPKAPAQYGKSEDSVALDADTGKWKGIKLFTINF